MHEHLRISFRAVLLMPFRRYRKLICVGLHITCIQATVIRQIASVSIMQSTVH